MRPLDILIVVLGIAAAYAVYKIVSGAQRAADEAAAGLGYVFGARDDASLGSDLYSAFNASSEAGLGGGRQYLKISPQGYGLSINQTAGGTYITEVFDPVRQQWQSIKPRKIADGWMAWPTFSRIAATANLPTSNTADPRATVRNPADFGTFYPRY